MSNQKEWKTMAEMYGIYNTSSKEFQFGIAEPSKSKAWKKLYDEIGESAYKWRFEARKLPKYRLNTKIQKYKDFKLRISYRADYNGKGAKMFRIWNVGGDVWIPNKHLTDDGTIKDGEDLDYIFKKRVIPWKNQH